MLDAVLFKAQGSRRWQRSAFSCSARALLEKKIKHSYRILLAKSESLHQEMKHDSECGNTGEGTAWGMKEMLFGGQSHMKLLTVTAK